MLTMYTKSNLLSPSLSNYLGDCEWRDSITESEMLAATENTQTKEDLDIFQACPPWDELIFVKCRFCDSSILPSFIKNHVQIRHTGDTKYEKDPEFAIFRKKPPCPKPTPPAPQPNPRASTTTTLPELPPFSKTSTSQDGLNTTNHSPRVAEQFLGWPNSPHGAIQQSPMNMVRVKSSSDTRTKSVIPGQGPPSNPVKSAAQRKIMPDIPLPPVLQDEPFNQTFSFSKANAMDLSMHSVSYDLSSTSTLVRPSTSYDVPSTSYDKPSEVPSKSKLSKTSCRPMSASQKAFEKSFPAFQLPPTIACEPPEEKKPAVEKLVLRRVLQTDSYESADGSLSPGFKGASKNKKDFSYFMVVKSKDRQQNNIVHRPPTKKQTTISREEKEKHEKIKKLENHKKKVIKQLFHELKSVKQKLDQCISNKREIERQLSIVTAELEETKRNTHFQTEALLKQKAKYEHEILMLKRQNEELTNSLAQEQMYRELGSHPWNYPDNHMSKKLQAIEEQKLELQRRIEELECESRELKNSSMLEKTRFDDKEKEYSIIINSLQRQLYEQNIKSEELILQKNSVESVCNQLKSQLAENQPQAEVFDFIPGLLTPQPTPPITSPPMPLAETLLSDIQNLSYSPFQSQLSPLSPDVFHQQPPQERPPNQLIEEEEVS